MLSTAYGLFGAGVGAVAMRGCGAALIPAVGRRAGGCGREQRLRAAPARTGRGRDARTTLRSGWRGGCRSVHRVRSSTWPCTTRLPETVISGEVVDDAHLHGVLAQIQNLGLHVVSVLQVPSAPEPSARRTELSTAPPDPASSDAAR